MLAALEILHYWLVVWRETAQVVNVSRMSALALVAAIARSGFSSSDE